ncbi:hypothetical protein FPZ12_044770 [Amycolatopsis acidicola]|uniref:Uncharacterized protein n=1 Tax=Amycolatopsis acidicola TaxID=2596893 RepID=A0A5N0UIK9_9PSEU|nr:hypothetical protein [Amycolatopsis acidicola]KAA9148576.1 hypothetical protein FPZ12_044770 [Amycolatopsis acidicola]
MTRTTLRSGSGDIAKTVRISDRTGIVAASSPPAAEVPEPRSGGESTLLALVGSAQRQPSARKVRRNVLLAGAAALFLAVGWIGGGTFEQQDDPTPTVAAGATFAQSQSEAPQAPTTPTPSPEVPKPSTAQPAAPQASETKPANPTTKKNTSSKTVAEGTKSGSNESESDSSQPRVDNTESTSLEERSSIDEVPEGIQHILDRYWNQHSPYRTFGR